MKDKNEIQRVTFTFTKCPKCNAPLDSKDYDKIEKKLHEIDKIRIKMFIEGKLTEEKEKYYDDEKFKIISKILSESKCSNCGYKFF